MTTTKASEPNMAEAKATDGSKPEMVTLDQLARELRMPPRDARMLLRLAAKQTKVYPTLAKEHIARQPWQWNLRSRALDKATPAVSSAGS